MKQNIPSFKQKVENLKSLLWDRLMKPPLRILGGIKYPGEEDISLLDIGRFFVTGLQKGDIQVRARSISFDFFLAVFPTIIFIFTLIPYIPVEGLQERLLLLLQDIMPPNTFKAAETALIDILQQPHGGLLSIGFALALYVSTNGIYSLIESFNASYHGIPVRSAFKQRFVALFLTLMLAMIVLLSLGLIIAAEFVSNYLANENLLNAGPKVFLIKSGTWLILVAMSLTMISFLYFYGPSKKNRRPFISVGSVTATLLLLVTTYAFNYFIGNFGQYNKIYGSIGTLIVILIWINFNSLQLIIGFELNASIENAQRKAIEEKESELGEQFHRSI